MYREFKTPSNKYRLAPFWFWDHRLEKGEILWQLDEMRNQSDESPSEYKHLPWQGEVAEGRRGQNEVTITTPSPPSKGGEQDKILKSPNESAPTRGEHGGLPPWATMFLDCHFKMKRPFLAKRSCYVWYPQGESNPCVQIESLVS